MDIRQLKENTLFPYTTLFRFGRASCRERVYDVFVGLKGIDRLDQPDRPHRNEVVGVHARIVELSGDIHHETEIMLNELRLYLVRLLAVLQLAQHRALLLGRKGQRQRLRAADIVHRILRIELP